MLVRLSLTSVFAAFLVITAGLSGVASAEMVSPAEEGTVLDEVALEDGELDEAPPEAQPQSQPATQSVAQAYDETTQLPPMSKQLMINTTKIGMPLEQVGNSMTVITRPQIQQMQATSLVEVLQGVPGVDVMRTGSYGGTTSVFMRGLNSEHTLIMVDGVRLNDPISPGRSFQFLDQISPDAVERVEVLRGPQGPLYGTDGMGGVINIITRRGEGKPSLYAKVSAGSFGTLQQDYGANGHVGEKLRSFIHVTRQDMRGFSSASSRYGNTERDGFHNTTLMGRVEYQPFKNWLLDFAGNFSKARYDLDNSFGTATQPTYWDDPNYTGNSRVATISGGSKLKLLNGKLEQITRLSLTDLNRENRNSTDPAHPYDTELSQYRGKLFTMDVQNNYYLHPTNTLTTGFNMQHEWGSSDRRSTGFFFGPYMSTSNFSDRSATDVAFYAQDHIQLWNRWFTTLGIRHDHHNRFGGYTTYRAASTYIVRKTGTSFKASFGTGFKAPTVYQLYTGGSGNLDLKPETSIGWDAGIEQALFGNRVQLGATVFQNQIKNMIQGYPPTYIFENISKARTQGLEAYLTSQPFRNMQLRASYTYTDTKNLSAANLDTYSGDPLVRRPRNKFSINMNYKPHEKVNINVDVTHIGQRSDLDFNVFPYPLVKLSAVTLVNVAVSYDVTKHVNVFAKMVNLMDSPYEMAKGYAMPRISAYGGLKLAL